MKVGVQLPEVERECDWAEMRSIARTAEDSGFDSIWVGDHLLFRDDTTGTRGPWEAWSLLAALGEANDLPLIYDIGSGLLDHSFPWLPRWLDDEPAARQTLAAGAGLVTFSGDKLLGGPQAGIIVGRADLVGRVRSHPMARALRVDSATYAALSATLTAYLDGAPEDLPLWRYALADAATLRARSQTVAEDLTLNHREVVLFNLLDSAMKDLNARLEQSIPQYLGPLLLR